MGARSNRINGYFSKLVAPIVALFAGAVSSHLQIRIPAPIADQDDYTVPRACHGGNQADSQSKEYRRERNRRKQLAKQSRRRNR